MLKTEREHKRERERVREKECRNVMKIVQEVIC